MASMSNFRQHDLNPVRDNFLFTIPSGLAKVLSAWAHPPGAGRGQGRSTLEKFMQKIIGVVCLVIGLWLLWQGHDVAGSIGSQFTKAFTGAPMGRATHYYLAGTVLGLFGGFLIFWKRK